MTTAKQQVTVISVGPSTGSNIWWVSYRYLTGEAKGYVNPFAVQANCELTAVLAFKRWVKDSNYGWEVVTDGLS